MNYLKVDNVNNTDLPEFIYCYIITGQAGFKETEIHPKKKKKKKEIQPSKNANFMTKDLRRVIMQRPKLQKLFL